MGTWKRTLQRLGELFSTSRAVRIGCLCLLLLAVAVTSLRIIKDPSSSGLIASSRSDFDDYYTASGMVGRGEDPYRVEQLQGIMELPRSFRPEDLLNPAKLIELMSRFKGLGTYLYLPFTAFVLLPLSGLDYKVAAGIFQFLSIFAFVAFLAFLYRSLRRDRPLITEREFTLPLLAAFSLLGGFLSENAANGNIAFFLLLLTGPGIYYSFSDKWWAQVAGGMLIGTAAVMKVTPVFLVLVLAASIRVYALVGVGLGIGLGIFLPALGLGWDRNLALLQGWYNLILETYNKYVFLRPWANNQTISGMIGKLFLPGSDLKQSEYGLPLIGGLPDKQMYTSLGLLVKGINAFLLGITGIASVVSAIRLFKNGFQSLVRSVFGSFDARPAFFEDVSMVRLLWLVTLVSLVTAGVSWYHAYCVLLLPWFLRFVQVFSGEKLLLGEKVAIAFTAFFSLGPLVMGSHLREGLALYSIFTFGVCFQALYLAWLVIASNRRPADGI